MGHKPLVVIPEGHLPQLEAAATAAVLDRVDVRTFSSLAEAMELAPQAEIGWFDEFAERTYAKAPREAVNAKWINTVVVGFDAFPISEMRERGQIFTNGAGIMPDVIAEHAVMGVLVLAKRLDEVVRAQDRCEWLKTPPGNFELMGSRTLILGYGAIGREIGARLCAFGVEVTGVRRSVDPDPAVLGADEWRGRLGEFDVVIVAAPNTSETKTMIGAAEFSAMKRGARFINIARGDLVDQPALIAALEAGQLSGAFLDVTTPEPLPPEHPLWKAPNVIISMHLAGASQTSVVRRGAQRFARNLERYLAGDALEHVADLSRNY